MALREFQTDLGFPGTSERIDTFVGRWVQPWRVPFMLRYKTIIVERAGREEKPTDPGYMVDSKDRISYVEPMPEAGEQAMEKIPAAEYRDYGFAPGSTSYDNIIRQTLAARPQMKMIEGDIRNLVSFIAMIRKKAGAPVRDLYLGAHGSDRGNLEIPLDGSKVDGIEYEDLVEAAKKGVLALSELPLHPRPKDTSGKAVPASLHIKGCLIGRQKPFLEKLKEALTSEIDRVSAPKFYQGAGNLMHPEGMVEYLMYEFRVSRPTPFTGRPQVVSAFKTEGFTDFNGKPMDPKSWEKRVPKKFDTKFEETERLTVHHHLQGSPGSEISCQYVTTVAKFKQSTIRADRKPTSKEDFKQILLQILPTRDTRFADAHPLPLYKRYGHATLKEMLDAFGWEFEWAGDKKQIAFSGTRYDYVIRAPVVDGGYLLLNWFPTGASLTAGRAPVRELLEEDSRFYTMV